MSGEDLRQWRERHKLSLRQLAPLLGVATYTIHRWEQGLSPVPPMLDLALLGLEQKLAGQGSRAGDSDTEK